MSNKFNDVGPKKSYFSYGSNMWKIQMRNRCSDSKLVGVGILQGWKWIVNTVGFATLIPSPGDSTYGLMYEISQSDEEQLDMYEVHYMKRMLDVEIAEGSAGGQEDLDNERSVLSLVYIDVERTTEGPPRTEYIIRMNRAIRDALEEAVPVAYIQKYLRPFIPAAVDYTSAGR